MVSGKLFNPLDPRQFALRFGLQERIVRRHQRQAGIYNPPLIAYSGTAQVGLQPLGFENGCRFR